MAKRKRKGDRSESSGSKRSKSKLQQDTTRSILVILLVGAVVLALLALIGIAGPAGEDLNRALRWTFGWSVWVVLLVLATAAVHVSQWMKRSKKRVKDGMAGLSARFRGDRPISSAIGWGSAVFIWSFAGLLHLTQPHDLAYESVLEHKGGGFLGFLASYYVEGWIGPVGTFVVLLLICFGAALVTFSASLEDAWQLAKRIWAWTQTRLEQLRSALGDRMQQRSQDDLSRVTVKGMDGSESTLSQSSAPVLERVKKTTFAPKDESLAGASPASVEPRKVGFWSRPLSKQVAQEAVVQQVVEKAAHASKVAQANQAPAAVAARTEEGTTEAKAASVVSSKPPKRPFKPFPLTLLAGDEGKPETADLQHAARTIRDTLSSFGIEVTMHDVHVGPTVTQFTMKPAEGVRLNQITTLQSDLSLALAAHPLRIEAPIPGKSLVGIEVPNKRVATVRLRGMLKSQEMKESMAKGGLQLPLGRNVSGAAEVKNLAKMPHVLIAGATGSGKSVCINSLLVGLLYQYGPERLRMILVDPKKVELTNYNGIPHLLTPVITEADKTVNALRWAVNEMERRFKALAEVGKRDIQSYNESIEDDQRLPYIVIVIDELADLMAVSANEVEAAIVRLAQMARAVGMHLVLATQRPSVNVITGLIKANVPARIAFTVASQVDSRTIIDGAGAEKLLGNGDMLYVTSDVAQPRRVQGAYVDDDEIAKVKEYIERYGAPEYDETVTSPPTGSRVQGGTAGADPEDDLYEEAKQTVIQTGKASASYLQRKLRIGYARAARLLDMLEERGVVGPADGAKPRDVYVQVDDGTQADAASDVTTSSGETDVSTDRPETSSASSSSGQVPPGWGE